MVAYVVLVAATLFFVLPFAYHKISGTIDNKYQEVTIEWAQATFVNLDGRVQIKKVNSARIISADGTFYTFRPNTVINLLGVANGSSDDSSR